MAPAKWRQFWQITLPLLTPVVFFNAIIQTIDAFKSFTPAFIISGGTGEPINSTLFYTLYLYQEAFGFFRMGYASALAWVLLLTVAAFTALLVPRPRNTGCTTTTDATTLDMHRRSRPPPWRKRPVYHPRGADRRLDPDALSAAVDAVGLVPAGERDLRLDLADPQPGERSTAYSAGLERPAGAASASSSSTRSSSRCCAVIGNVLACSLAAFAFARLEFHAAQAAGSR